MKLSRPLRQALATKNFFRGKVASKKIIVIVTGAAIVLSGLFYSFWNTLPQKTKYLIISPIRAQEISEKNPWTKKDIEKIICAKPQANATVTDPTLALFKLDRLCQEIQTEEPTEEGLLDQEQEKLEKIIAPILIDTPMEPMIEPIIQQEKIVAAFLVGIALKESAMGRHAPHKYGKDCYNYWGYKGGINPTAGGYSCFNSPEHAVEVVGQRLRELSVDQSRNTPSKMLVWKCGSSCIGHSKNGVQKWVSDVSIYFNKINRS